MPILKNRYNYRKVYRPNGARYADGKTCPTASMAAASAEVNFRKEFGNFQELNMVIEIIGVTRGWTATIIEIKD